MPSDCFYDVVKHKLSIYRESIKIVAFIDVLVVRCDCLIDVVVCAFLGAKLSVVQSFDLRG